MYVHTQIIIDDRKVQENGKQQCKEGVNFLLQLKGCPKKEIKMKQV